MTASLSFRPLTADNFLIIGFTLPAPLASPGREASVISRYLRSGALDYFHIRKPSADTEYVEELYKAIPKDLHCRLIMHSHFHLYDKFRTGGIHFKTEEAWGYINKDSENIIVSRSCHSLEEIEEDNSKFFTYSFLSPIFDSISKSNYTSKFSLDDSHLLSTLEKYPVIALGGIMPCHFSKLFDSKFAGAALLGYLWSPNSEVESKIETLLESRVKLRKI